MQERIVDIPFIPKQVDGKALDLEEMLTCSSGNEASGVYGRAKNRLLNPHVWHKLTGTWAASFELIVVGEPGQHREAHVNNFIRIDIPGPGTVAGEGYDWVRIEKIDDHPYADADESFGMLVRASANPEQPSEGTAHFFQSDATSAFILRRNNLIVTASYHGRNERPNTENVPLTDKVRNALVASAALAGVSEIQWKGFLTGLLKE